MGFESRYPFQGSVAGKGIDNFQSRGGLTFSVMGGGAVSSYKRNSERLQGFSILTIRVHSGIPISHLRVPLLPKQCLNFYKRDLEIVYSTFIVIMQAAKLKFGSSSQQDHACDYRNRKLFCLFC